MDNKNLIFLIIIIILCIIFWNNSSTEGFKNQNINVKKENYNKYNETYIQPDNDSGNSDSSNNKNKVWKNMNLDQCLQKCSQSDDCIAISRDFKEDHEKTNCYPRNKLAVVHSNRKGNAKQRKKATQYNTYVKSNVPNQIKCINDNKLNMNQNVFIKSFKLPKKYVVVSNNEVKLKSYKLYGSKFIKEAQFKLIPGLEGSGTVSFKVSNTIENDYYLSATSLNTLSIQNIYADNTNFKKRCSASFELIDGLSDETSISLKTFNSDGPGKFVSLSGKERLNLIDEQELNHNDKLDTEDMTFQLVDTVNHNNIIESNKTSNGNNEANGKGNGKDTFNGDTTDGNYHLRNFPNHIREKLMAQIHPNNLNINNNNNNKSTFQNSLTPTGRIKENEDEFQRILKYLKDNPDQTSADQYLSDKDFGETEENKKKLILVSSNSQYELPTLKYRYDYQLLKRLLSQNNDDHHVIINKIIIPFGITVSVVLPDGTKNNYYQTIDFNEDKQIYNYNMNKNNNEEEDKDISTDILPGNGKPIKSIEIKMNNQNSYFNYVQDNIEKTKLEDHHVLTHFYPLSSNKSDLLEKKQQELKEIKKLNETLQKITQDKDVLNDNFLLSTKNKHDQLKLQKLSRDYYFLKNKYDRSGNI